MSIERNDRSFDNIFDEIQIHSIPVKYIDRIKVILKDGTEIDTSDPEHQKRIIAAVDVGDIHDLQISLDYDAIKKDVTKEIKNTLGGIFKDDGEAK